MVGCRVPSSAIQEHNIIHNYRRFRFEPIAFKTSGSCGQSTKKLLREIGAQVPSITGERRETEWLLQGCSIAVARGNATSVLLAGSSGEDTFQESPESPALTSEQVHSPPGQGSALT